MKYVTPSYEIMSHSADPTSVYKHIESCARTCYQSFDYISEKSYERLITLLLSKGHEAMIEHANLRFIAKEDPYGILDGLIQKTWHPNNGRLFLNCTIVPNSDSRKPDQRIISGNIRAFRDAIRNHLPIIDVIYPLLINQYPLLFQDLKFNPNPHDLDFVKDLKYMDNTDELSKFEQRRHIYVTVRFKNVNRGFSHEDCRMREALYDDTGDMIEPSKLEIALNAMLEKMKSEIALNGTVNEMELTNCSFAQESTRYVDYSKAKFGNGLVVTEAPIPLTEQQFKIFEKGFNVIEECYMELRETGLTPEIARDILPIRLKTEIVNTASLEEWHHIFKLRTSQFAHPVMRNIMRPLCTEFKTLYPAIFDDIVW